MRSSWWNFTPQECADVAARINARLDREEIEHQAVERERRTRGTEKWDRLQPVEQRAVGRVIDAKHGTGAELDRALRDLARDLGRPST